MWVVYRKGARKIIGITADGGIDPDKETAIKEIVGGTVAPGDISEYEAIQVTDREKVSQYLEAFPAKLAVAGTTKQPKLVIREPEAFSLYITTDASDKHPIDGIPTIPADGASSVLITIQKVDERAKPQTGKKDNDQLYLRANHGIIRDEAGNEAISSVALNKGEAKIRLFSETVKRVTTLQIMAKNPEIQDCMLRIEFV
ncbi:MAG: hypothetical protein A4E62_00028 [Syntrophorhabdus sp. PtaU1.Bin002]|nr:MAG: hypothetical protein A4E58_01879 [Syntrophorhabdus sp. PtaB.Bin006]OPY74171.1 MAG: hypothetical protein A4E62_00028 [Syntrophorhabdus sp. PtaU1.Bin002]